MDAAQYVVEPADLWTSRVPARHEDMAPKVVQLPEGGDAWSFEDGAWLRPLGLDVAVGHGPLDVKGLGYSYGEIRQGAYDVGQRIADMAADEVDAAAVFPTYGMSVRTILDPDLHLACVRAYNDGVWEWAQAGQGRLVPQGLVPCTGLDDATQELERVVTLGYRGIVFSGWPSGGIQAAVEDDPFWAICQESGVVVNLVQGGPSADRTPTAARKWIGPDAAHVRADETTFEAQWVQSAGIPNVNLAYFVMSGVLDRFPRLQVALIDAGAGWLPFTAELLDWNYRYSRYLREYADLKYMPSDYVRRQVKATLKGERSAVEARHDVGVGALMWHSNYPKSGSSWPQSRQAIQDLFRDVPDEERRRMAGENCADFYGVTPVES